MLEAKALDSNKLIYLYIGLPGINNSVVKEEVKFKAPIEHQILKSTCDNVEIEEINNIKELKVKVAIPQIDIELDITKKSNSVEITSTQIIKLEISKPVVKTNRSRTSIIKPIPRLKPPKNRIQTNDEITQLLKKVNSILVTADKNTIKNIFGIGTLILMFDHNIKRIEDIAVGEQVMGPDSLPRTVLKKSSGIEQMFQIACSRGLPIICTAYYTLMIMGAIPHTSFSNDHILKRVSVYSDRGHLRKKTFPTENDAEIFINSLPKPIFNLSIIEFLLLPKSDRERNYLFHKGIEFPEYEIPIDPYLIGYWLGDGSSDASKIITADIEIIQVFRKKLAQYDLELSKEYKLS